ncbi:MAG: hypothetical protein JNL76_00580 [Alphaproteobacteria bacterium]|nr:hypothetical protein [Alphaproteobacteria bacterium]
MSGTENNRVSQFHLLPNQEAVVTCGGWRIEFNAAVEGPQIFHNGQEYTLADGVMVPAHVANDRPIDGAPAVVLRRLNQTDIGQMIETDNAQKGILLAPAFQHLDRKGNRVGPVVDYFAAPKDTGLLDGSRQLGTYNRDIKRIADLGDVCGHGGILLLNDAAIYDAAEENDLATLAMWHMPTLPLVNGRNIGSSDQVNPDNMYAHKNKGLLQGSFTDEADSNPTRSYWTATELRENRSLVYDVDLTNGRVCWDFKDNCFLSSRPVRAELHQP